MLKQIFSKRQIWLLPLIMMVAMAVAGFAILGAFLSPMENTHNLPIALVNGDQGLTAGGQNLNFGNQLAAMLTGPQPGDALKWDVLDSRATALDRVRQTKYFAAVIIPPNYTASLMSVAAQTGTAPARIELLENGIMPTIGNQVVQNALQNIFSNVSVKTGQQLQTQVKTNKTPLALPSASLLADPVQTVPVQVVNTGEHSGHGINVFFLSLLLTIAGLVSGILATTLVQRLLAQRSLAEIKEGAWAIFGAQVVVCLLAGLGAVAGVLGMAWILNMDVSDWLSLELFCLLYVAAVGLFSLLCQAAFRGIGAGLASLFLILFSLPASGGLFPMQSLPDLWQWLYAIVPMRYFVDGVRSVLFLNGEVEAGLGNAIWVLTGYAVGSAVLAALVVWLTGVMAARKLASKEPQTSASSILEHI